MKKTRRKPAKDELRADYDFSKAVRGKYAGRMRRTTTLVVLEPDVAAVFDTSESVNSALRALVAASGGPVGGAVEEEAVAVSRDGGCC